MAVDITSTINHGPAARAPNIQAFHVLDTRGVDESSVENRSLARIARFYRKCQFTSFGPGDKPEADN